MVLPSEPQLLLQISCLLSDTRDPMVSPYVCPLRSIGFIVKGTLQAANQDTPCTNEAVFQPLLGALASLEVCRGRVSKLWPMDPI